MGHRGSCFGLCHWVFCLFSSKSFIVSDLTFRSLIHFEFIFVYDVRKCSNFILLHVVVQFSHAPMGTLFLTKEARIYNGAKTASSINGAGKTGQLHVKE